MSVGTAIDRLSKVREALAERTDDQILDALCELVGVWRDPSSGVRREIENKLPDVSGFSPETLRAGLEVGFEPWTAEAFRDLVEAERTAVDDSGTRRISGYDLTSVVLGGSIPMPSLLSILLPLVLRSPVLCKAASRDPITPALVASSLREIDPLLGSGVEIVDFDKGDLAVKRSFFSSPCVVATGSDETIDEIASLLQPSQRFVRHGHRVSLAVVKLSACDSNAISKVASDLALDVALWDQLGCLSPIAIFGLGPVDEVAHLAEAIAGELARLEARLPRGEVDLESAALIRGQRSEAEMRAALGRRVEVHASEGGEWSVILEDDTEVRPAPLHRFVRIVPVRDASHLDAALRPIAPHLAGVALAGFADNTDNNDNSEEEMKRALVGLGASRICVPGELQAPPFSWPRDNRPVLRSLGRRDGA